ncbi:GNAT family N-acetyltransferase [Pontivivens ytuae]|uniref:GNAT family N-acetyltransferase n=1 Tax=Pontivivens ytuae TaxID=2789856 RepID=A0A7S9QBM4_9RHOB|nr:GNAT family N-acetyltransferase [Pontivivens ytuae]QPH52895.1 GNAT family N-acetyltransferase [Pontivivens ytuae]
MNRPCLTAPTGATAAQRDRIAATLPRIETARLVLRAPELADYAAYARIASGPDAAFIGGPMSAEEAWLDFCQMSAGWLLRGSGLWTVADRESGATLGFVTLGMEWEDEEPELGFLLLPEAQGRGIAAEAAMAARTYAFDTLGWSTVVSYIDPGNTRSAALANRLGARRDPVAEAAVPGTHVYRHVPEVRP